jgi:hypothetical protein
MSTSTFAWAVCGSYNRDRMGVLKLQTGNAKWRAAVDTETVEYGVGGSRLFRCDEVRGGQVRFAVPGD